MQSRSADEATELFDPVLKEMMSAVHQFGGTVNRLQGDGVMALFGAPHVLEDHALRACHAGLAMQAAVKQVAGKLQPDNQDSLQIRIGIHSGEVVVKQFSNDISLNYDAVGVTAHLAARLEQNAPVGSILISAETHRQAEGLINTLEPEQIAVNGIAEPMTVFRLTGAASRLSYTSSLGTLR